MSCQEQPSPHPETLPPEILRGFAALPGRCKTHRRILVGVPQSLAAVQTLNSKKNILNTLIYLYIQYIWYRKVCGMHFEWLFLFSLLCITAGGLECPTAILHVFPTAGAAKLNYIQNVNLWQKLCILGFLLFGEKGNVLFGNAFQISSLPPVTNAKWQQEPLRKFWFRMRLRPRARLSWISFTHCRVVPPGFYWEGYANIQLMIEMRFGNTIIPGNRVK